MSEPDLTVAILREIRDEVRGTNQRLDTTNERLDTTVLRLDTTNERLDTVVQRLEGVESRLAGVEETLKDLAAQLLMLTRYVKNVVDRHEQSIDDLRERVVRIETLLAKP